jgi:hypothetical protein
VTALSISWRRTASIVIIDLRRLISFYRARAIVRRTLAAERKAAQRNFRELKKMQTAGEQDTHRTIGSLFWFFLR